MIRTRARLGLIVLSGTALATSLPAFGQESGAANSSPQLSGEEIVVTARKSSERIQDVPISVTAISADALRDRGATDLQDVLRNIPGLSNSGAERSLSRYAIRGLYTAASSPTVGIYLDDISLVTISTTFSGALDPVFFDMERIEVLKGPQGTL
ncbi:MAG: Plug domain-containing protein [Sphingopyxis sp.]|nr:Plug domain-containing protein [Sphingopyxis sp.]